MINWKRVSFIFLFETGKNFSGDFPLLPESHNFLLPSCSPHKCPPALIYGPPLWRGAAGYLIKYEMQLWIDCPVFDLFHASFTTLVKDNFPFSLSSVGLKRQMISKKMPVMVCVSVLFTRLFVVVKSLPPQQPTWLGMNLE